MIIKRTNSPISFGGEQNITYTFDENGNLIMTDNVNGEIYINGEKINSKKYDLDESFKKREEKGFAMKRRTLIRQISKETGIKKEVLRWIPYGNLRKIHKHAWYFAREKEYVAEINENLPHGKIISPEGVLAKICAGAFLPSVILYHLPAFGVFQSTRDAAIAFGVGVGVALPSMVAGIVASHKADHKEIIKESENENYAIDKRFEILNRLANLDYLLVKNPGVVVEEAERASNVDLLERIEKRTDNEEESKYSDQEAYKRLEKIVNFEDQKSRTR